MAFAVLGSSSIKRTRMGKPLFQTPKFARINPAVLRTLLTIRGLNLKGKFCINTLIFMSYDIFVTKNDYFPRVTDFKEM
jgi:hypothetical protein